MRCYKVSSCGSLWKRRERFGEGSLQLNLVFKGGDGLLE